MVARLMRASREAGPRPASLIDSESDGGSLESARIAQLEAELGTKAALITTQAADLAHFRKLFERASEAARIGVWLCELDCEALTWTDVVYDLFDLPRGAPLIRPEIMKRYTPDSRARLDALRSRAIAEGGGFAADFEIVTFAGRARTIRITATVEREGGRPVRIFGMKQDVTEELRMAEALRRLAECDPITGLASRARFQQVLAGFDDLAGPLRKTGALVLLDLDGFKALNDTYGHAAGDVCLKVCGERIAAACPDALVASRVGGDEFALILPSPNGLAGLDALADRLLLDLNRPIATKGDNLAVGASIGIATARPSVALYEAADRAMYAAKAAGRNCWRHAPPA